MGDQQLAAGAAEVDGREEVARRVGGLGDAAIEVVVGGQEDGD